MNNFSNSFSRRSFLAGASSLGALYAASKFAAAACAGAGAARRSAHREAADCRQGFCLHSKDRRRLVRHDCGPFERVAGALQRRIPDRPRRRADGRGISDDHRFDISARNAAHGHASARPRGAQHALAFRPHPWKFSLWRRGHPHLGAYGRAGAHGRDLSQMAEPKTWPRSSSRGKSACATPRPTASANTPRATSKA